MDNRLKKLIFLEKILVGINSKISKRFPVKEGIIEREIFPIRFGCGSLNLSQQCFYLWRNNRIILNNQTYWNIFINNFTINRHMWSTTSNLS